MIKKIYFLAIVFIIPFVLSGCILDLFATDNSQDNMFSDNNVSSSTQNIVSNAKPQEDLETNPETKQELSKNIVKTEIDCHKCEYCTSGFQKQAESFSTDKTMISCIDCSFDNDCVSGYTCNNNICINKKILESKINCKIDEEGIGNCQNITCPGCNTGNPKCVISEKEWNNNKCIDCNSDYDCKDNYVCRNFTCLKIAEKEKPQNTENQKETGEKLLSSAIPYYDDREENIYNYTDANQDYYPGSTSVSNQSSNNYYNLDTYFCGRIDCFENKFANCNSNIVFEDERDLTTTRYEIIGYESGRCKIKTEYIKYPNPELENKSMVCLFDNTKSFADAEYEIMNNIRKTECTGELADILKMF